MQACPADGATKVGVKLKSNTGISQAARPPIMRIAEELMGMSLQQVDHTSIFGRLAANSRSTGSIWFGALWLAKMRAARGVVTQEQKGTQGKWPGKVGCHSRCGVSAGGGLGLVRSGQEARDADAKVKAACARPVPGGHWLTGGVENGRADRWIAGWMWSLDRSFCSVRRSVLGAPACNNGGSG